MSRGASGKAKAGTFSRRASTTCAAAAVLGTLLAVVPAASAAPDLADTPSGVAASDDGGQGAQSHTRTEGEQPTRTESNTGSVSIATSESDPKAIGPAPAPSGSSPLPGIPFVQAVPVPGQPAGLMSLGLASTNVTAPAPSDAHVVDKHFVSKHIVDLTVYSESFGGTLPVRLLLPKDWYSRPNAEFPVLYLLPGYGEPEIRNRAWTFFTDAEKFFADKNVLVVLPPGGKAGFFSNWWNYGNGGSPTWETFHVVELPKVMQRSWRAGDQRAIAGLSMGGFGAMSYASRHPGFYDAAASYSGFLHTTMPGMARLLQATIANAGLDPDALWGDPLAQRGIWAAHDPYLHAENLRGTALYVSAAAGKRGEYDSDLLERLSGTLDAENPVNYTRVTALQSALETASYIESRSFVNRLEMLGIPVTTHFELEGLHRWPYWEDALHDSWPLLAEALGLSAP